MKKCKRCSEFFKKPSVKKENIEKNPEKYELCVNCRKFKFCKNCNIEFHHKQNQTCSEKCAKELKEKTTLLSCGTTHNLSRNSISRKKWQDRLIEEENIVNVFQREDVKLKSKQSLKMKYGVEHISKLQRIKNSKNIKIKQKIKNDPDFFKKKWWEIHTVFMNTIGYDPRLHIFGRASKESLSVFLPTLEFCINLGIEKEDIFLGYETKDEFFLKQKDKIYFYDFTIKSLNIIIEFHGIAFHSKNIDENWRNPFTNETSEENINLRIIKNRVAKESGFELLEIWSDSPAYENIEICKKFILNKYESKKSK